MILVTIMDDDDIDDDFIDHDDNDKSDIDGDNGVQNILSLKLFILLEFHRCILLQAKQVFLLMWWSSCMEF